MGAATKRQYLLQILRLAADSQPVPKDEHFIDDEELLTCWSLGLLEPRESQRIIDHLSVCPPCRKELAVMLNSGILERPELNEELREVGEKVPEQDTRLAKRARVVRSAKWPLRHKIMLSAATVLAASVLVAIVVVSSIEPRPETELASAETQLASGNAGRALEQGEELWDRYPDMREGKRLRQLLTEAGCNAARSLLVQRNFAEVSDIEHRVSSRAGSPPELLSLKLQAEQGIPAERSLDYLGSLKDYGYELDGSSLRKGNSFPDFGATSTRINKRFSQALAEHPYSVNLLVNYGQFLFEKLKDFEKARRQFATALILDDRNPLAHLGLGLIDFEEREFENALVHFRTVAEIDPDNLAGCINTAICLERLAQPAKAREYWRRARQMTDDADLQQEIERRLFGSEQQHPRG